MIKHKEEARIFDEPVNQLIDAKLRIHQMASAMGIEVALDELHKFAVLLIALQED